MVNWSDTAEILKDSDAFIKIIFAFFGIQMWELFMTFGFEWSLLTRLFFFLSRYCMVFSFIGLIISLTISHPINCGALFTFNSWTGNMAILCASTSLMLRTVALWERKRSVVIPLGLLSLAHWILLYRTMFVLRAVWDPSMLVCRVASTDPWLLNITFFFTMAFDFVILSTTAVALMARHSARTDLWKLLFTDGLVYFVVSFSMNCVPAVLNLLNLNSPMNVIATIPAATVSSIAACRAVMRLLDYNSDVYVHSITAAIPSSDPRHSNMPFTFPSVPRFALTRPEGVLVTTEHITMSEFPSPLPTAFSKTDLHRYDVEAGRRGMDIDDDSNSPSEKLDDTLESSEYTATT
ncbi:hypothetical protein C8F04DRAFT_1247192 [Mycena alexandri]|uniref:Uncharacterized protein n=1 Tax=Mycena alexandri TaxID=1745969 RepID=A0AAD6TMF8_9AGAR|nr:hypothetical protein C8F04DRAFT_1247192 [Mycena alexandri]